MRAWRTTYVYDELDSVLVEVLIEVLCLFWRVYKDVGLCNRSASEVVCAKCCFVRNRTPVIRLLTVIAELEERVDQLFFGLHSTFSHGHFELLVILCSIKYR